MRKSVLSIVLMLPSAQVSDQTHQYSARLIFAGLHVEPNVPSIPGIEYLKGEAFHSSQYKGRAQLTGHDVLIVGCGETGMGMQILRIYMRHC